MRLVVTGGGTGGHVFPALEIAKTARERGDEVLYIGSQRGQERRACEGAGLEIRTLPSEPLYRITSLRGMKGALNLARATVSARKLLAEIRPSVVFSSGGYASAPVVTAARRLKIPYVIHEQNTVPGRTNRLWSRDAYAIATVFRSGAEYFPGCRVERTGMPIRQEFRHQAELPFQHQFPHNKSLILVMGGSQGAQALNEAALATAIRMTNADVQWLHVTGVSHFERMQQSRERMGVDGEYDIRAYLEAPEMAGAIFSCELACCRSGAGTLSELAALRKPSILVPYPQAFADHQRLNALEFEQMGAASVLDQAGLQPSDLDGRIRLWLHDADMRARASQALADWDIPNSSARIMALLDGAASA